MGQGLLVKRMGKKRVIAETGAGQHGMATATMAAKFGFDCTRITSYNVCYTKLLRR